MSDNIYIAVGENAYFWSKMGGGADELCHQVLQNAPTNR